MTKTAIIYIELNYNKVEKVSKEIISHALQYFDNIEVNGVVLGDENTINSALEELKQLGLKKLFVLKDNLLDSHNTSIFANVTGHFIQNNHPDIFLMGATETGRDLAPRIASKLNIGLTADCTDLKLSDEGTLLATRPTYGGKMMATIISKTLPNFATIRSGAFKLNNYTCDLETEIIHIQPEIRGIQSFIEVISTEQKNRIEDWTCSEIIVSGGLGLKTKENFDLIYKLAEKLNARPAASRCAVELGWAPASIQVGQTGSSVSPKLYLAFGISGAMQHLVGITNADRIIAINTDKSAPIMDSSDSAIVADAVTVINAMIERLSD